MTNQNDTKILELKSQIQEKKDKLSKTKKRFTPITNCSIELDGTRYNLNTLPKDQLVSLMVKLNIYKLAINDLGLLDDYFISGFKINDWMTDIKTKFEIMNLKEEENKLQEMENRLEVLLSNEKKVELEIGSIESMLK